MYFMVFSFFVCLVGASQNYHNAFSVLRNAKKAHEPPLCEQMFRFCYNFCFVKCTDKVFVDEVLASSLRYLVLGQNAIETPLQFLFSQNSSNTIIESIVISLDPYKETFPFKYCIYVFSKKNVSENSKRWNMGELHKMCKS